MAKTLMDEFHLQVFVPTRLPPSEAKAMRRVLISQRFHAGLLRAARAFFGRYSSLAKAEIKIAA